MNAPLQGRTASTLTHLQPLLQVESVNLEYRTPQRVVRATHEVSFEVDPADRFVLLGPSGCGKSTLLKVIGNEQIQFSVNPTNTYPLADFLHRIGAIKNRPATWQDYFFQNDEHSLQGS